MTKQKNIGFLRVSTDGQDLEKNKADILKFANDKDIGKIVWVEETASGKVSWKKRKIAQVIDSLQTGDTLIVSELSRLGRSMLEIMEILSVATQKGIRVFAAKGNWQLDNSIQSKVIAMAFAMAAEIERDLIASRTKEALAAKKRAGVKLGRPRGVGKSKLDQYRPEIEAMLTSGSSVVFIAKRYGTSRVNLSRWIEKNKIKRPQPTTTKV
jgi:DNA invertase Pin-like site-specific DNA recombinase